jgi:hypothetical protein
MLSRSRALFLVLIASGVLVVSALPAVGAETSNSEFVIIRADDVLEDDLYAGAIKVVIEGVIDGDLIAFAGEEVVIEGTVTGSVFALAPRVTINGEVGGSLRVSGNDVRINGKVGHDVVAAAADVHLDTDSSVGNDVLVWAWDVVALGHIGGDLTGSQRHLEIAGVIEGDVDVSVGQVAVVDELTVAGDFGYRSDNEVEGLGNATVGGAIVHKTPLPPNIRVRALNFFGRFLVIVFLTITALAVAWGWPARTERAVRTVKDSPARSWGSGALLLASPFLLAAIAALVVSLAPATASFPLLAILAPLILALAGVVLVLCLVAGIPAVGRLGGAIFKRLDVYGAILVGAAVVGLVWLLPIVGWLVPLVVLPIGMGGWLRSWKVSQEPQDAAT